MSVNFASFSAMIDVVCGVIENSEGQFLACLRPAGKHLGGLWEFPGGKVDPGESPESGLSASCRKNLPCMSKSDFRSRR